MNVPYYTIQLPEVPRALEQEPWPRLVTRGSPLWERKHVERFAYYVRREGHFDFLQFETSDTEDYRAYLFANRPNQFPRVLVGACCFRFREYKNADSRWGLQWVWLHPYSRGRGILSAAWDGFHATFGNFLPEPPYSRAMESFLRKRGLCVYCWQPLDSDAVYCSKCEALYFGRQTR